MELRGPVAGDRVIAQWLADDAGMLGCRPHVVLAVARPGLGACDGVRVEACGLRRAATRWWMDADPLSA